MSRCMDEAIDESRTMASVVSHVRNRQCALFDSSITHVLLYVILLTCVTQATLYARSAQRTPHRLRR